MVGCFSVAVFKDDCEKLLPKSFQDQNIFTEDAEKILQ